MSEYSFKDSSTVRSGRGKTKAVKKGTKSKRKVKKMSSKATSVG